jgi:N-dimethylarginine dimethylaminohydrolase
MVRLLMCQPHAVVDRSSSMLRQWERLVELLGVAGEVSIERIEPAARGPHGAATAHAALVCGNLAIMSSRGQRSERAAYRSWLVARGYATTTLAQTAFGGAADAAFDRVRPYLYVGYGQETDRAAAIALAELTDARVVPVRVIDETFRHLNSVLCPLGSGHVLFYPDAFSSQSQRLIRTSIDADALIELSPEDAFAFASSPIEIDDALVVGDISRQLSSRLRFAGYRVFSTDLSEFAMGGAVPRALALRLDDGPASAGVAA